jgi:hypothetical protein
VEALFIIVPIFIGIIFVCVIGVILFRIIAGDLEWTDNNAKPVESLEAKVVTKRTEVSGTGSPNQHYSTATYYYCTFELPYGERVEFQVKGSEFGQLVEGDRGSLTFQGTRYHGFRRHSD